MNLKVDWVVDALLSQIRLLERREGRRSAAVRLAVEPSTATGVAMGLREHLPDVELEVVERNGRPQVLTVSFDLDP